MYQLNLTDEERILLVELLDGAISEIRMEIADTDKREYKMLLKDREVMMKKLFRDMTAMEVATTG
jgi:hypothetical protein